MRGEATSAWQLSGRQTLMLRCWADACVCYASPSGDTHLLPLAQGLLLQRLEQGPAPASELAAFVAAALELPVGAVGTAVPEMLSELGALKLVEAAAP